HVIGAFEGGSPRLDGGAPSRPRSEDSMRASVTISGLLLAFGPSALSAQTAHPGSRICLGPTSVESAAGNAVNAMNAVRETFTSFLTGPTISVTPLSSRLSSQAREEAK